MTDIVRDLKQIVRRCPNIVLESAEISRILKGESEKIISEYNEEEKRASLVFSDEVDEIAVPPVIPIGIVNTVEPDESFEDEDDIPNEDDDIEISYK